ncbi:cation-chloride cotransporter 1-like [Macadamia integrifolia]|uniref:cation-chloride cotransporter 1-like n=1 Tax=Macadamia integrifolia TaxID=60698 RepID=UPI001C4FF1ED|nr:cation-chloride cotransporter 1-like [Macadamia integrifolia]XP_042513129.1 cation-chloride cotransporter 1-like [Macadamia integrifolia]
MENGEIENADEELPSPSGRKYRPVVAHDRAVLQMSSIDTESSSSSSSQLPNPDGPLKKVKVNLQSNMGSDAKQGTSPSHARGESKLELFGFDSLVNILGLKSMTGEQIPAPSSLREREDVSIRIGQPKVFQFSLACYHGFEFVEMITRMQIMVLYLLYGLFLIHGLS